MMKIVTRKSRNFSILEEELLISIVGKYKSILDNRKTDAATNFKKAEYWKKIETEFNRETADCYRTMQVLKNKYDNIKKRLRKKSALGGDAPATITFTNVDDEIETIICKTELREMNCEYTDDTDTDATRKRLAYQDDVSKWASGKIMLNEVQQKAYIAQQELKRECMLAEHKCKLAREKRMAALEEEEFHFRMKCMKEKHALELEILQIKKKHLLEGSLSRLS